MSKTPIEQFIIDLSQDLKKKVKKPPAEDQDYFIIDGIGKVIEQKGLKPDLSNPETIKILEGSSAEIVQYAAREIWKLRKERQRLGEREVSGGRHSEPEEIKIKEEIILHEKDKRRGHKIHWPDITVMELLRPPKHKKSE